MLQTSRQCSSRSPVHPHTLFESFFINILYRSARARLNLIRHSLLAWCLSHDPFSCETSFYIQIYIRDCNSPYDKCLATVCLMISQWLLISSRGRSACIQVCTFSLQSSDMSAAFQIPTDNVKTSSSIPEMRKVYSLQVNKCHILLNIFSQLFFSWVFS